MVFMLLTFQGLYIYKSQTNYNHEKNKLITENKILKTKNNKQQKDLEADKKNLENQQFELVKRDNMINSLNSQIEDLKKKLAVKNSMSESDRIKISRGGDMPNISLIGVFKVTFYTPYDGSGNGITATGKKAIPGQIENINSLNTTNSANYLPTVAVDPRIIPLGTKIYIEKLGEAIASDTGSAIRGNILDYCVSSRSLASQLGVKNLKVWVINQ